MVTNTIENTQAMGSISAFTEGANIDAMLAQLTPISEEELGASVEELRSLTASQPNDKVSLEALRQYSLLLIESGHIEAAMQNAMILGALACTHDHLRDVANEVGQALGLFESDNDEDDKSGETTASSKHNAGKCANCKAGRRCSKA